MKAQLVFHEKVIEADNSIVEIKIWSIQKSRDKPHGFKYSMAYIKGGKRVVGYDNSEGKGDHRHFEEKEKPYTFQGIDQLFEDFYQDIGRQKNES